jgi:DNA-binding XRE family transcriptional regulator
MSATLCPADRLAATKAKYQKGHSARKEEISPLRRERLRRGLTLEEASPHVDLTPSGLSQLELNKSKASLSTARKCSAFYGVQIEELFPDGAG